MYILYVHSLIAVLYFCIRVDEAGDDQNSHPLNVTVKDDPIGNYGLSKEEARRLSRSVSPAESLVSQGTSYSSSTFWGEDKVEGCCYGICNSDPATKRGRKVQMIRVLFVIFVPIVGIAVYAASHMYNAVQVEIDLSKVKDHLGDSHSVGQLIHAIQIERTESVLFLASNGKYITKEKLESFFSETNVKINEIDYWPEKTKKDPRFDSKIHFRVHLDTERDLVLNNLTSVADSIIFYLHANSVFIDVLVDAMSETKHALLWRPMLANKLIVRAKEGYGLVAAIGIEYYMMCHLPESERESFIYNIALAEDHLNTAMFYASFLQKPYEDETSKVKDLDSALKDGKRDVIDADRKRCSLTKGMAFFQNMAEFLQILYHLEVLTEEHIAEIIEEDMFIATEEVVFSVLVFVVVAVISPILVIIVQRMTSAVAMFAESVNTKSHELAIEKRRANKLLFTMLPKEVAIALINKTQVEPQYYDDTTVYFSDIVGFTKLSSISTPMQIVDFLNKLYNFFDDKIDLYDVYKVETIGDAYMVASGLPVRNGRKHAGEIGSLALTLRDGIESFIIPHLPKEQLRLRIGMHTGQIQFAIFDQYFNSY